MELYQLRYAVAVAETGNFTRASERCHITQPSLSQQIINLEEELGHKLFHRLGRKAVLTEAGTVFLERARRILFEVDDATREIHDSPALERKITIGAITTLAPYLLPQLLALCKKRLPHLQVNVREDLRPELTRGVIDGELDLAIVSLPVKDPRLSVEPLFAEPLLLVVGKPHPLAMKHHITLDDLAKETFVLLGSGSSLSNQVQRFFGDHNFEPKIGFRCAQVATVKALVALGVGVSIMPQIALNAEDRSSIIIKPLADRTPTRDIGVIRHTQRYQSLGAEQFIALLREHVGKRPPR
ncbi:MAG TPA: LysR substrate-binding domain-containing protein [Opitutaceae bacterium]|jgi:LysR family hydrogen peroxide-inducible transcriptional activator|nr:LysR substrate-binding domain-containing protein [Opitutaceae bacterium]